MIRQRIFFTIFGVFWMALFAFLFMTYSHKSIRPSGLGEKVEESEMEYLTLKARLNGMETTERGMSDNHLRLLRELDEEERFGVEFIAMEKAYMELELARLKASRIGQEKKRLESIDASLLEYQKLIDEEEKDTLYYSKWGVEDLFQSKKTLNFARKELKKTLNKNFNLLFKTHKLYTPAQLERLTKEKGERWHGEMLRRGGYTGLDRKYQRPKPGTEQEPGSDKRLAAFFIPISINKENTRNMIRAAYRHQMPQDVDIYFVMGELVEDHEKKLFEKENKAWGDMLTLYVPEAMNDGKTWHSFKLMHSLFGNQSSCPLRYDFIGKLDDDVFLFDSFTDSINEVSRNHSYIGLRRGRPHEHMQGRSYLITQDLLKYVVTDPWVENNIEGDEDLTTAKWMIREESHSNWVYIDDWDADYIRNYDFDFRGGLIHMVKVSDEWNEVIGMRGWNKNRDFMEWLESKNRIPHDFTPYVNEDDAQRRKRT
eukprot:TRINITY_DN4218_c0_g1_i1.p1 TRINITY_DN4218_c0_g1~~TRINITY_DN4218_c0_g1_i1.p1  ORF type:complete len:483 (-),score=127.68 TRINITY_DN4218_c0_g1_i1:1180-2628(-)